MGTHPEPGFLKRTLHAAKRNFLPSAIAGAALGGAGAVIANLFPGCAGAATAAAVGSLVMGAQLSPSFGNFEGKLAGVLACATFVAGATAIAAAAGAGLVSSALVGAGVLSLVPALGLLLRARDAKEPEVSNPITRQQTLARLEEKGLKLFTHGTFGLSELSQEKALKALSLGDRVFWAEDATAAKNIPAEQWGSAWSTRLLDDKNRGLALYAATGSLEGLDPSRKHVAEQIARLREENYQISDDSAYKLIQNQAGEPRNHNGYSWPVEFSGPTGKHRINQVAALDGLRSDGPKVPLYAALSAFYESGGRVEGKATAAQAYASASAPGFQSRGKLVDGSGKQIVPELRADLESLAAGCARYGPDQVRQAWHAVQDATVHGFPMAPDDGMAALMHNCYQRQATPEEFPAVVAATSDALRLHFSSSGSKNPYSDSYVSVESLVARVVARTLSRARGES